MDCNTYLPKQECQFLHLVMDELDAYQSHSNRMRVLLFPPLPSRLRYLIHSHVEELPDLTTFSVGERGCRRVVVCYSDLRDDDEEEGDVDPEKNYSFCKDPRMSKDRKEKLAGKPKPSNQACPPASKRPDKPLYMPRAVRQRLSLQNSQHTSGDRAVISAAAGSEPFPPEPSAPETTETAKSPSPATQERRPSAAGHVDDAPALGPGEAEPDVWEQPLLSLAHMTLGNDEKDKEFLPSVSCTDLTEEIKTHLKEASAVSIEHAHNDFFVYVSVNINLDEFRHVIEIYNFPTAFKTDDLLDAFSEYSHGGMKVTWVDDTHALGVFASETAANRAISITHPMLKARTLAEGSKKAKAKAFRSAEFIQPVKERPKTDCAVAQRMVTRALGLQKRNRIPRKSPQKTAVMH